MTFTVLSLNSFSLSSGLIPSAVELFYGIFLVQLLKYLAMWFQFANFYYFLSLSWNFSFVHSLLPWPQWTSLWIVNLNFNLCFIRLCFWVFVLFCSEHIYLFIYLFIFLHIIWNSTSTSHKRVVSGRWTWSIIWTWTPVCLSNFSDCQSCLLCS